MSWTAWGRPFTTSPGITVAPADLLDAEAAAADQSEPPLASNEEAPPEDFEPPPDHEP